MSISSDSDDGTNLEREKALSDENWNDQDSRASSNGNSNDGVVKPRKSLLEYVNQVQKAQRDHQLDFNVCFQCAGFDVCKYFVLYFINKGACVGRWGSTRFLQKSKTYVRFYKLNAELTAFYFYFNLCIE